MNRIERKQMLMSALRGFQRWEREGKLPRGFGHGQQHFYDPYHDEVRRTDEANVFTFRIQVFDSPDGDEWLRGRFRLINDMDVEVLESDVEHC